MRHRLLNIDVVIRRSLIYSLLVTLITATYLVLVLLMERVLQGVVGYRSVVVSLAAGFVIALGFIPARNVIQRWIDVAFFGGSQERLAEENQRLREEIVKTERTKAVALLASGLAHEIKNPLAAIKTFIQYLPERSQDPEFVRKFERIVSAELHKIQGIVNNLLTFAKPQPIQRKRVVLGDVLGETVALLNGDCLKRRVTVATDIQPNVIVDGDRMLLKQALLNLCLNSLEAMEQGGTLSLTAKQNGHGAELIVQDTGCGIDPKQLPYVFDPFYTTKPTGTGLGLAVVHV